MPKTGKAEGRGQRKETSGQQTEVSGARPEMVSWPVMTIGQWHERMAHLWPGAFMTRQQVEAITARTLLRPSTMEGRP